MKKIALINHGCAKNLVDSELMLGLLASKGYEITLDENDADVVIINTCSFIHDAEKESVQSILGTVTSGKKVIVTGCLPQKHKEELKKGWNYAIPDKAYAQIDNNRKSLEKFARKNNIKILVQIVNKFNIIN